MKITKLKKLGKGKYKVTFDNREELVLYEDVIVKHCLLLNKVIDNALLKLIKEDNYNIGAYQQALNYIEIRIRSKKEIEDYLQKKGYDDGLIQGTIFKLSKDGHINDKIFIKAYVNDKLNLTHDGPYKIKRMLENYGVEESEVDNVINNIDRVLIEDKMIKIVDKQLHLKSKYTGRALKNKVSNYMINLGYDSQMVWTYLNKIDTTDNNNLDKEYQKLYKKYAKKYDEPKLRMIIRQKLYQKGYENINFDDITIEK